MDFIVLKYKIHEFHHLLKELLDLLRHDAEQLGKTLAMLCPWNKLFLLKLGRNGRNGWRNGWNVAKKCQDLGMLSAIEPIEPMASIIPFEVQWKRKCEYYLNWLNMYIHMYIRMYSFPASLEEPEYVSLQMHMQRSETSREFLYTGDWKW